MSVKQFIDFAKAVAIVLGRLDTNLTPYDILTVAEDLQSNGIGFVAVHTNLPPNVAAALASPEVMSELAKGRKIHAIKELRAVAGIGLKEAKDAVEDWRITNYKPEVDKLREQLSIADKANAEAQRRIDSLLSENGRLAAAVARTEAPF